MTVVEGPQFRSLNRDDSLSGRRLVRQRVWNMLRRSPRGPGISTGVCNHLFRTTGITAYLENRRFGSKWPSTWQATLIQRRPRFMTGVPTASSPDEIERIGTRGNDDGNRQPRATTGEA